MKKLTHCFTAYYNEIINSVIRIGQARKLIVAFCTLIRSLIVDHLHVVGDIFDRGPYPHLVMDTLMNHRSVDIQWGNHDISWMGAASGCRTLICNVIRISAKYGNLSMLEKEDFAVRILSEFGLSGPESHIINGHIPVQAKKGESPIKCNGKLLIIDGGFSKAYFEKTGIAGYTLIFNSYALMLAAHEPFESVDKAVQEGCDIASHTVLVQQTGKRKTVADTDAGKVMRENIKDLEDLLQAYREGKIKEQ